MNVTIQAIHFNADQKLLDYVQSKVEKLNRYYERIIEVEVRLKLENTGQVKDKIVELIAKVPKDRIVATGEQKTFEAATDKAVDLMQRQIKKYKTKLFDKKRAQREV